MCAISLLTCGVICSDVVVWVVLASAGLLVEEPKWRNLVVIEDAGIHTICAFIFNEIGGFSPLIQKKTR
jgi:hypothetical protein